MQTMLAPPPTVRPLEATEIRQHISEGRHLIASGQLESATVRLWTAFEAAVRLFLNDLGRQTDDPIWISDTPHGLSAQAVAYGVIDPEDRDVLLRFLSMRDASAHGNAGIVDAGTLQEVSWFAERTLDEMGSNNKAKSDSGDDQMPVTIDDVIAFINAHPGHTFYTTGQQSPFTVTVNEREFVYTLSSGKTPRQSEGDMEQLLQKFAELHSLRPSDYHHPQRPGSRFSSYFVSLMSAIQTGLSAEDS